MDRTRRRLIGGLATVFAAASAGAQSRLKAPRKRITICTLPSPAPAELVKKWWGDVFVRHGLVDGDNVEIAIVAATSMDFIVDAREWEEIARRVVASRPDVIVVHSTWLEFFRRLTADIPIVFVGMIDPEHHGSIDKARRPGGNVTGAMHPFFEMQEKRCALLKELRPGARRVALVFAGGDHPYTQRIQDKFKAAAGRLGLEPVTIPLPQNAPSVGDALRDARVDLVDFIWSCEINSNVFARMLRLRIASSFACGIDAVKAGGLLCYLPVGTVNIAASLTARVLRGENVATIPAEQTREFRLALNLSTARALRLTVPQAILLQANDLVE